MGTAASRIAGDAVSLDFPLFECHMLAAIPARMREQRHVHQSNEDPEIRISPIFDDIEVSNAISKLKRNTQPSHFEFLLH